MADIKLNNKEREYWRKTIDRVQRVMEPKHKSWEKLLASYELKMDIPGLDKDEIIHVSRMYPLVRQILSSVAFHYPEVFVNAKPNAERMAGELDAISLIMERAGNVGLDLMGAKAEIHQAMFDALGRFYPIPYFPTKPTRELVLSCCLRYIASHLIPNAVGLISYLNASA